MAIEDLYQVMFFFVVVFKWKTADENNMVCLNKVIVLVLLEVHIFHVWELFTFIYSFIQSDFERLLV